MNNVISLGRCKTLLARLDEVRQQAMRAGDIEGFAIALVHRGGRQSVILDGKFLDDAEALLRIAMRVAWDQDKDPPEPQARRLREG